MSSLGCMMSSTLVLTKSTIPVSIFFSSLLWFCVISRASDSSSIEMFVWLFAARRLNRSPSLTSIHDSGLKADLTPSSGTAMILAKRRGKCDAVTFGMISPNSRRMKVTSTVLNAKFHPAEVNVTRESMMLFERMTMMILTRLLSINIVASV